MSNPIEHARDALAGRVDTEPVTVICSVCEREIPAHTARAIPAIGFMCPENVEPKCEPQRNIWDEIRDADAKDRQRRIDAIAEIIDRYDPNDADWSTPAHEIAAQVYAIAIDPTRIIERD